MAKKAEWHSVRCDLDPDGTILSACSTTYWDDRTYTVRPVGGPFDSVEDVLREVREGLDIQLTLW